MTIALYILSTLIITYVGIRVVFWLLLEHLQKPKPR